MLLVLVALVALSLVAVRPALAHDRYSSRGHHGYHGNYGHRHNHHGYSRYGYRYGGSYYGRNNYCSPYGRSYYGYGYSPGFSIGIHGHNGAFYFGF
jgi:hypothetical protein